MFAGIGKADGLLECQTDFASLLGLPVFVAAPSPDAGDHKDTGRDEQIAVAIPQLFEPFATDFLVDFLKDIGHEPTPVLPEVAQPWLQEIPLRAASVEPRET
jgi:hypothetical protein